VPNRMGNAVMKVSMMLLMHMVNMANGGKSASVDTAHRMRVGTSNPWTQLMLMNVLGMEVHGSCSW